MKHEHKITLIMCALNVEIKYSIYFDTWWIVKYVANNNNNKKSIFIRCLSYLKWPFVQQFTKIFIRGSNKTSSDYQLQINIVLFITNECIQIKLNHCRKWIQHKMTSTLHSSETLCSFFKPTKQIHSVIFSVLSINQRTNFSFDLFLYFRTS